MKTIIADYLLTCNENFDIIKDGAICFNKKIIAFGKKDEITKLYPQSKIIQSPKNSVVMPGLINPHVHLEFSANKSNLIYGDFIIWLQSIINQRDDLVEIAKGKIINEAINSMLKGGITTIGAISSFGAELNACNESLAKVVFFNEILGTANIEEKLIDFKERLQRSQNLKNDRLIPAISIHSPYSTHPKLAKEAINLAKENNYTVSSHFMESLHEKNWLENSNGGFLDFFSNFNPNAKPFYSQKSFLEMFKGIKSIFTHGIWIDKSLLNLFEEENFSITHCPVSNRLLGCGKLNLNQIFKNKINLTLGTDGLSSNISLNLWNEMRAALMIHNDIDINFLSKQLILSVTRNASNALGLSSGSIDFEKSSDFAIICHESLPEDTSQLPLQLILQTKEAENIYIEGEEVLWK